MGSRFLPWTYAVCLVLLSASPDIAKGNCKDFDFEKGTETLSEWSKTGDAFDNQPTYGDNAHIRDSNINTNVQGDWWIGTFENRSKPTADPGYLTGDYPIGTLTSPKFRITGSKLSFLFGGGCDKGQIRVELLVNGQVAREAFADDCREKMRRREWNVGQFRNKIAQIRIVDASRKGHVNFDDLWGDFTCFGNDTTNYDSHNATSSTENDKEDNGGDHSELLIVDEPLSAVNPNATKSQENSLTGTGNEEEFSAVIEPLSVDNRNESNGISQENPITGTDDEYDSVHKPSKPHAPIQHTPVQKEKDDEYDSVQNFTKPHAPIQHTPVQNGNDDEYDSVHKSSKPHAPIQHTPVQKEKDDKYDSVQNFTKPHAPIQHTPVQNGNEKEDAADQIAEMPHLNLPKIPLKVSKGQLHDNLFGETKISSSNIKTGHKRPLLPKAASFAKIVKASFHKLRDNSSNNSLPGKDDEIRNLTCKSFLVKIKTGKPWDNDFLFTSNGNYQSTRREIEVKVLDAYEDDKDFRGAFFTKFSSSEEPGEVKAFFVLRFRAVGKFLGKLIDAFGVENVSAAGCIETSAMTQCPSPCPQVCAPSCQSSCCQQQVSAPVAQCPSPCPQSCAPSCQASCCQQQVSAPVAQCPSPCPQSCAPSCQASCCQQQVSVPVAQCPSPCPQSCAPSCQASCCQRQVSAPVAQCPSPCPQSCAPSCQSSCCQQYALAPVAPVPMPPPPPQPLQITVSKPQVTFEQPAQQWYPQPLAQAYATRPPPSQGLSGFQCSAGCSPNCAPICSPTCCQFYNTSQRKGEVKNWLRKQVLQEERR